MNEHLSFVAQGGTDLSRARRRAAGAAAARRGAAASGLPSFCGNGDGDGGGDDGDGSGGDGGGGATTPPHSCVLKAGDAMYMYKCSFLEQYQFVCQSQKRFVARKWSHSEQISFHVCVFLSASSPVPTNSPTSSTLLSFHNFSLFESVPRRVDLRSSSLDPTEHILQILDGECFNKSSSIG